LTVFHHCEGGAQSRSHKAEASFWIATPAKGRLAMTVLHQNRQDFWRLV
jgi:hypothetical protein